MPVSLWAQLSSFIKWGDGATNPTTTTPPLHRLAGMVVGTKNVTAWFKDQARNWQKETKSLTGTSHGRGWVIRGGGPTPTLTPPSPLPHWRDSVMKTTVCSPALQRPQPLLQFQTQGLGWCVHGKWPQRQGPASNESTASASKSPSKYQFIGLLIKITDSLSDGCPETQGAETAVKRPRKPLAKSLPGFLNLFLHSLPPFPLAPSPTAASRSPPQVNPPSTNRNSLP